MITLRPDQLAFNDGIRNHMRSGVRSVLGVAPTGFGKTCTTVAILAAAADRGKRSLFVVHRRELIRQSIRAFDDAGLHDYGIIAAGFQEDPRAAVQIAGVQSLARRMDRHGVPDLIVWDEAHHCAAQTWRKIHATYAGAYHIGLTATPARLDGQGLREFFPVMVLGPSVATLIRQRSLAPYRIFGVPQGDAIDVTGAHKRMGEYVQADLVRAASAPRITGSAVSHYRQHAAGQRALVRCVSIERSKYTAEQFRQAGIPAAHVDGETPSQERDATMERFAAGEIRVVTNVSLFGEGFDCPAASVYIDLAPTLSKTIWLQNCGRVLRYVDGKTALILDHSGNCQVHGFPDDDQNWSLDGCSKDPDAKAPAPKQCPKCYAWNRAAAQRCTECSHEFAAMPREVDQVDGTLAELDPEMLRRQRNREQGQCQTLDQLVELGKQRKYPLPQRWAAHIWQARQAKRHAVTT